MATIPVTTLTTSPGKDTPDICDGFALFPKLGAARAGVAFNQKGNEIGSFSLGGHVLRFRGGGSFFAKFGVCGPAYGISVVTGKDSSYDPAGRLNTTLVLENPQLQAGFEISLDMGFEYRFGVSTLFKSNFISFTLEDDIDFISLLEQLIAYLIGEQGKTGEQKDQFNKSTKAKAGTKLGQSLGFIGFADEWEPAEPSDFGADPPLSITATPSLDIDIDVLPLLENSFGLEPLVNLEAYLKRFGGGIEFGPGLSLGLPVKVEVPAATINQQTTREAGSVAAKGERATLVFEGGDPSQLAGPAREVGLHLRHTISFSFGFYAFFDLLVFKVFHVRFQTATLTVLDLSRDFGAAFGPYDNSLSFKAGTQTAPPLGPPAAAPKVGPYTTVQPSGLFGGGALARYAVSFVVGGFETGLGPFTEYDPGAAKSANPLISAIPVDPTKKATGRRVYRQFQGRDLELRTQINNNTTTTYLDIG